MEKNQKIFSYKFVNIYLITVIYNYRTASRFFVSTSPPSATLVSYTHNYMSTRVDDLWFEDGSLIIKAEEKLFRVSKCLLAARSIVFKDMLSFPPVPDGEMELIDGIPVVTLSDSAKDVEVFLRAILDSRYVVLCQLLTQFVSHR